MIRKRLKEINIFSMSVVDLFACALGAFILIALILFPYYLKSDPVPCPICPDPTPCPICEPPTPCPICEDCPPPCPEVPECPVCPPESVEKKDYLLVLMSWEPEDDVDMYVKDPTGAVYSYQNIEYPHSPAQFAEDNKVGPGNEIWIHPPEVVPGIYEVFYHYFAQRTGSVLVEQANIVTQENQYSIPDCRLRRQGEWQKVATINVDTEGNIQVNTYQCN